MVMRSLPICVYIRGGMQDDILPSSPLGKHSPPPFSSGGRLPTKELGGGGGREESRKRPFPLSSFDKKKSALLLRSPLLLCIYTHWIQLCWKTKETNCICVSYGTAYVTSGQKKSGNL